MHALGKCLKSGFHAGKIVADPEDVGAHGFIPAGVLQVGIEYAAGDLMPAADFEEFPVFLRDMKDPLKEEFLLPTIADVMIKNGTTYSVLPTFDRWFGVTYREDKPAVTANFRELISAGEYREDLYSDL